jgi:hypothetical protein
MFFYKKIYLLACSITILFKNIGNLNCELANITPFLLTSRNNNNKNMCILSSYLRDARYLATQPKAGFLPRIV